VCTISGFYEGRFFNGDEYLDPEKNFKALKEVVKEQTGGVAVFVDTKENHKDYEEADDTYEHFYSGEAFFQFLKKRGENVTRSKGYKNTGTDSTCYLYTWRVHERVTRRRVSRPRRKAVVKKAKAA
jgi:hypothetical protein